MSVKTTVTCDNCDVVIEDEETLWGLDCVNDGLAVAKKFKIQELEGVYDYDACSLECIRALVLAELCKMDRTRGSEC